jgi:hypothetical protein
MQNHPHIRKRAIKNPFMIFSIAFSLLMLVMSIFVGLSHLEGITGNLIVNLDPHNSPILGDASSLTALFWILAAVIVVNAILVYEVYNREVFISYILSSSSMIVSTLIFVATSIFASLN